MITIEEIIKALQKGLPMGYDLRDEIASIVEKADKYKWHNLRKNPNDLPLEDDVYEVSIEPGTMTFRLGYNSEMKAFGVISYDELGQDYFDESEVEVIAWREIELFEVEE